MWPAVLAAIVDVSNVGLPLLFAVIALETLGLPLPGETALVAAGVLASQGHFPIEAVIAVAAAAAIIGDNIGFEIGKRWGRRLFTSRRLPFAEHRAKAIAVAEPFFDRHGPKAVFLGRWVAGLRITAAWMAGISGMRWPPFFAYNAAGGILWATSVGLLAYFLGHSAETIFKTIGLGGVIAVAVLAVAGYAVWEVRRRRRSRGGPPLDSAP